MNFKEATDILFSGARHEELAQALGVSVSSVRQARLNPKARAYREPPSGWEKAVERLSRKKANKLLYLSESVHKKLNDNIK